MTVPRVQMKRKQRYRDVMHLKATVFHVSLEGTMTFVVMQDDGLADM